MTLLRLEQAQERCRLEEEKIASLAVTAERLKSNSSLSINDLVSMSIFCFLLLSCLSLLITVVTRLNAFTGSCLFNASAVQYRTSSGGCIN